LVLTVVVVVLALRCWTYRGQVKDLERRCVALAHTFHRGIERTNAMIDGVNGLRRMIGIHKHGGPDDA
jgi:hypothetical protein